MKRLLLAVAVLFVIAPPVTRAAPHAKSEGECQFFWDVALTARAMAMEGIRREQAQRVIDRIYNTGADARVRAIVQTIVGAAQMARSDPAGAFARELATACLKQNGNMDAILGASL